MSVGNGKLLAYLAAKGEIVSTQYGEEMVLVHCRIPQKYLGRIDYDDAIVTPHNAAGWVAADPASEGETIETEPTPVVEPEVSEAPIVDSHVDSPIDSHIAPFEAPRD